MCVRNIPIYFLPLSFPLCIYVITTLFYLHKLVVRRHRHTKSAYNRDSFLCSHCVQCLFVLYKKKLIYAHIVVVAQCVHNKKKCPNRHIYVATACIYIKIIILENQHKKMLEYLVGGEQAHQKNVCQWMFKTAKHATKMYSELDFLLLYIFLAEYIHT